MNNTQITLVVVAIILAALSLRWGSLLAAAVILLGVSYFVK